MKKSNSVISSIISSIWLVSCGTLSVTAHQSQAKVQDTHTIAQNPTSTQPRIGTVKDLTSGDLLCYVKLVDSQGVAHEVGATFDICAAEKQYLNHRVRAFYHIESVSDCESAEPCGKTKRQSIITKMVVLDKKPIVPSSHSPEKDSMILSNGEWAIAVGNYNSWTGVNGTGNLTYSGCHTHGNCLKLTGGKVYCQDGKCSMIWTNQNYVYSLNSYITENTGNTQKQNTPSTLTVYQGTHVILTVKGLKPVSGN